MTPTDVTSRGTVDEALRESEARYRELLTLLFEAFCVIEMIFDEDGKPVDFRFVEVNSAFEKHATRPMLGKRIKEVVPDYEQFWLDRYGHVALTGEPVEFENVVRGLGEQWFHVVAFRIGDRNSRQVGVEFKNITDRKRAEEALRKSHERLEQMVRERTAELSYRARQLQLLTSELTMAEQRERQRMAIVLHDGLQQTLAATRYRLMPLVRSADPSVSEIAKDASDMLADAIAESTSLTADLSPPVLHLGGIETGLEWLVSWLREKHGLAVNLEVEAPIGDVCEAATILLFHSTRELLFNVVKHAGVRAATVHMTRLDEVVRIIVSDDGTGFDPAQLRSRGGGAGGFGLFSISERIDMLGGRMEVDSAPGMGSRFTLTVPAELHRETESTASFAAPVSTAVARDGAAAAEGRIRVVLVDDHVVMRQGIGLLLEAEPDLVVVGEASDGESALSLVRDVRPDVVLMDVSMPGMNGIEATRRIRAEMPGVEVIGLSMYEESERARPMLEAGANRYLAKTGPADELVEAIRACAPDRPRRRHRDPGSAGAR